MSIESIRQNPLVTQQPNGIWLERDAAQGIYIVHTVLEITAREMNALQAIIKSVLGLRSGVFDGIAISGDLTRLVFDAGASQDDMLTANNCCAGWGLLSLDAAGGRSVNCNDAAIASDPHIGYHIRFDGRFYARGQVEVTDGSAAITLPEDAPTGEYEAYCYRLSGNFASGHVSLRL